MGEREERLKKSLFCSTYYCIACILLWSTVFANSYSSSLIHLSFWRVLLVIIIVSLKNCTGNSLVCSNTINFSPLLLT